MADSKKISKKYEMKLDEDSEESTNYLDIWRENPAYKDISGTRSNAKLISLMGLIFFIAFSTLILTSNLYISFGLPVFLFILFLVAFHNDFYFLEQGFRYLFRHFVEIKPFDNFKFYMLEDDPATLLIINKKDMLTMAIHIYRVEVLAENIKPTINQFLYALYESKIPYTYQVVQKPIIKLDRNLANGKKEFSQLGNLETNNNDSYKTYIYFSVYFAEKGILSLRKLNNLVDTINVYSRDLKSNFSANFHHTKISLLKKEDHKKIDNEAEWNDYESNEGKDDKSKEDLIDAIRTLIYGKPIKMVQSKVERKSISNIKNFSTFFRLICLAFIIGSLSLILLRFKLPLFYILGLDLVVVCIVLFLWWRELLFFFTKLLIKRYKITQIHLFSGVKFYRFNKFRDTLFIHINNILLLSTKMFSLRNAIQPSFAMPDKFFRAMNNQKTPFIYTLNAIPIEKKEFGNKCGKLLHDKTKIELEGIIFYSIFSEPIKRYRNPDAEYLNWIEKRNGIWKTFITISTSSYKFTNPSTKKDLIKDFYELEDKL